MGESGKTETNPISVDLYNQDREKVSKVELDSAVFGAEIKPHLLWEVVSWQEACHRRGTAKVKTRGEVSGTGKKPWKQKGTGRSRHGSMRSPLWPGGGKTFGPAPRDYSYTLPKKIKKNALKGALSMKLKDNKLFILDRIKLDEVKTKKFQQICDKFDLDKALFIIGDKDEKVEKSARNIPKIKVLRSQGLNVRDLLRFNWLVMDLDALKKVSEALK